MLQGYARIFVDIDFKRIDDYLETCGDNVTNDIYIAVDRMSVDMSKDGVSRLVDSVETAFYEGKGVCRIMFMP